VTIKDVTQLICRACGRRWVHGAHFHGCPGCGGVLLVSVPDALVRESYERGTASPSGGIAEQAIPGLQAATRLGEGHTPMIPLTAMAHEAGLKELWLKNESVNPTASYKDRLNAVAMSVIVELGFGKVATSSTGNQAVSLAAYAAAADVRADVFLPVSAPEQAAGEVERLGGHAWVTGWDLRAPAIRSLVENHGYAYVGRNCPRPLANPYGLEGYKTIAYEIVGEMNGQSPDVVFMPSCGGDGIFGVWRGFLELQRAGVIDTLPRMVGCHLTAAPSVTFAWKAGLQEVLAVHPGESIGLSLVDERGGDHALWTLYESDGFAIGLSDDDLLHAMARLGGVGILAEPAGAAGMAGFQRWVENGGATSDRRVVVVMTGGAGRWPSITADLSGGIRTEDPLRDVLGI
jgi:threonine synthase